MSRAVDFEDLWSSPGYSAIDHQLDPLLDVCRAWLEDLPVDQRQQPAEAMADTIALAAVLVRNMGIPADPLDIGCDTCSAPAMQPCWHLTTYADLKHPHPSRVAAVKGTTKSEWML